MTDPHHCPTCGSLVRVVGRTTMHYEPVTDERAKFEAWVTAPPRERNIHRYADSSIWPGQYRPGEVQIAWEAWKEAKGIK